MEIRLSTPGVSKLTAFALLPKTPQLVKREGSPLVAVLLPHPCCKDNPVQEEGHDYLPGRSALFHDSLYRQRSTLSGSTGRAEPCAISL